MSENNGYYMMAVTVHDHITSPVVFGNTYLFLIISDVCQKIMVTTNILAFDSCTITNYEDSTLFYFFLSSGGWGKIKLLII